jgi:2,3-dihydroxybenzoate-AMP ligase
VLDGCVAWPDDDAARYRAEGIWRGERLGDLLRDWARADPGRVALVTPDRRWTYAELDVRADRLAAGLSGLGVASGDRVVVQLPNGADLVLVCVALFRLGALPVLALPSHRRVEITYLCAHAGAVAYVCPDAHQGFDFRALAAEVRAAAPSVAHVLVAGEPGDGNLALAAVDAEPVALPATDPGDVAFFLLSGGTTGLPKLIPRTHDDYAHQLRATAREVGFGEDGVYLAVLPVAHNAALGCPGVLGALRAGGRAVLAASPAPDDVFPVVERERPTLTTVMPSVLGLWVDTAELFEADLRGVVVEVGGSMLPPDLARRAQSVLGCVLTHWFGMAEGLLCFTRPGDPPELAATTQGRPLCALDEIRIVDDLDRDVATGQVGHLLTRGPTVLRGYYRAPEFNATAFAAGGFLRTGDLARLTAEGHLVAEGRVKDIVNRGGEKVPAEELEDHLRVHPAVRDAAIVAMPDRLLGEKTCAFVVVAPAAEAPTLRSLRSFLTERGLADYKLPDRLELVDGFPMTGVGKIDKAGLRTRITRQLEAEQAARRT